MSETEKRSLPSNAYRALEKGEVYEPVVAAEAKEPELTWRSVGWSVFFCVVFTVAASCVTLALDSRRMRCWTVDCFEVKYPFFRERARPAPAKGDCSQERLKRRTVPA